MIDRQNFMDAIDASPADPSLLLLYADWLAEHGEDDRGWRWLGERGKVPDMFRGKWTFWKEYCHGEPSNIGRAGSLEIMPLCDSPYKACQVAAANIVRLWGEYR